MGLKSLQKKSKGCNIWQMLRIGMLALSFVLMLIALLLFGTIIRKDMVKMTIKISPDGFTKLVKDLEKFVDDTTGMVLSRTQEELHRTKQELARVNEELRNTKEQLDRLQKQLTTPSGSSFNPFRGRRGVIGAKTSATFDIAIRPLTLVNFDDLDKIPMLGMMIKIFANIILNFFTFPLLALVVLTIAACFLYLCKIFGRLFCYLVAVDEYTPTNKSSWFLRTFSIISFLLSYVRELLWAVIVTVGLLALFLIYVKGSSLLEQGDWTNCWLGLLTIDFTRGEGVLRVQVACICAFIAILLNLMDQIVNISCPSTHRGYVTVASDQNKDKKAPRVAETTT